MNRIPNEGTSRGRSYLSPSFWAIVLIKVYFWFVRPILGQNCRFYPSCSQYAMTAFSEFGFLRGFWLAFRRILRCNPWHSGGFEPVPQKVDDDDKEENSSKT